MKSIDEATAIDCQQAKFKSSFLQLIMKKRQITTLADSYSGTFIELFEPVMS